MEGRVMRNGGRRGGKKERRDERVVREGKQWRELHLRAKKVNGRE